MDWISAYDTTPAESGWFAVLLCWDPEEGWFPSAAQWDGVEWSEGGAVAKYINKRFETEAEAEQLAEAHDPGW